MKAFGVERSFRIVWKKLIQLAECSFYVNRRAQRFSKFSSSTWVFKTTALASVNMIVLTIVQIDTLIQGNQCPNFQENFQTDM